MDFLYTVFKAISYLCIFFIVLYLVQLTSKYVINKNNSMMKNRKIKIIERLYLGKDKEIALIKYKDKEYMIGISTNGFCNIDILNTEDDSNE
ncbi:flagellar biosynthetic protein FliO [Alkalithermobacter paradoxus]|uniref:Flagellar biosynthesis protein, FliO n=1 Tax=Alkalithermobacter paradoxus TaxID=29349 RepID=A0A1V4IB52_9FIRM|nr:hypothetical protein CLOTH_03830 [[Clostridium] thermoalcaliphilum]